MWIFSVLQPVSRELHMKKSEVFTGHVGRNNLKNRFIMQEYIIVWYIHTMYWGRVGSSDVLKAKADSIWVTELVADMRYIYNRKGSGLQVWALDPLKAFNKVPPQGAVFSINWKIRHGECAYLAFSVGRDHQWKVTQDHKTNPDCKELLKNSLVLGNRMT